MRVGFHTNAFVWAGVNDIVAIAEFAHENGFDFLEVGPGIPLDEKSFQKASRYAEIRAFCFCRNFIDDDRKTAEEEKKELFRRMEFASSIGASRIVSSTGISAIRSLPKSGGCNPLLSLDIACDFLSEASEKAEKLHLELAIENCPMYRNIATSPYMWRRIFDRVTNDSLKLCYDPSHFVWQMIDVYSPVEEFGMKISHVHLKDTVIDRKKLDDVGILHNTGTERGFEENQWWRHAVMGDGEIDWKRFLALFEKEHSALPDLSFEMEDYRYECVPGKVKEGLIIQRKRLEELCTCQERS